MDTLVGKLCNAKFLLIFSDEETNSSTSCMIWGWVNCKECSFLVNYFFKVNAHARAHTHSILSTVLKLWVWHEIWRSSFQGPLNRTLILAVCTGYFKAATVMSVWLMRQSFLSSLIWVWLPFFTSAEWRSRNRTWMAKEQGEIGRPVPSPALPCARVSARHSICHLRLEVPRLQTISTEQVCIYSA